jgi:hypothetical protein
MRKLAIIFALILCANLSAQNVSTQQMQSLATHPRLILRDGDVDKVHAAIRNEPGMERLHDYLFKRVERIMDAPVSRREKTGKRLLSVSREVLERVWNCSFAYLLTGDARYAARAEAEMLAAAAFEDWNPSHFLDVGEMTAALALGYDWLYDKLSEQSRRQIEEAIITKGLLGAEKESQMWFYKRANNWNQVCNGGFVMGALAVADREPELAAKIIEKSLASIALGLKPYAPEGVYPEGYSYWSYGTWYQVLMIEALRTALGDSCGLEKSAGFLQSADFMNYMVAPSGRAFNFSDCGDSRPMQNLLLAWFAGERCDMSLIYREKESLKQDDLRIMERRFLSVAMLFLSRCNMDKVAPPQRKFWYAYGEQPLFVYRGGWDASDDVYLAAKGGSSSISHAHMDAGSFVYEWGGVRWAIDLGKHDYNRLEQAGVDLWNRKQESGRWDIFRIGAQSHNVLTFNGKNHNVEGIAEITAHDETSKMKYVELDLTPTFKGQAQKVTRRAELDKNDYLTIVDHVEAGAEPTFVEWKIATRAEAEIVSPNMIMLTQDGKSVYLKLRSKLAAEAKVWPEHAYKPYEIKDEGVSRVGFVLELKAGQTADIVVNISPEKGKKSLTLPKLNLLKKKK